MGVYIRGFNLPEKSDMYYVKVECAVGKNPVATIWRKDLMGEMSFGAFEVIPVSRHGRLGDLDGLYKEAFKRSEKREGYYNCLDAVISAYDIENTPTIISEEEEK